MPKKRAVFGGGILLLLLIAAGYGYYLYNKPRQSAGDQNAQVTISADSLFSDYQHDEQGSDKKYLGKVIEVSGTVSTVQLSGQSEIWILSTSSPMGGGVNCQMYPGQKMTRPRAGDKVTLKGKCTGYLMDVNLADCAVSQ